MKSLTLSVGCALFVYGGWFMAHDTYPLHVIIGYSGAALFGAGFVVSLGYTMLRLFSRPWATIHKDRLNVLVPIRFGYKTFMFEDIGFFYVAGSQIYAAYSRKKGNVPTGLLSVMLDNLPEICNILNERLERYRLDAK